MRNKLIWHNKKTSFHKGFSVAEALIALLIGSLILGASAPMISKQIKHNSFSDAQMSIVLRQVDALRQEINTLNNELREVRNQLSSINSVPSGTIAFFEATTCPPGWSRVASKFNGRFPRFAGSYTVLSYNSSTQTYNTSGTAQTLSVGATQEDIIRNIVGTIAGERPDYTHYPNTGAFYQDNTWGNAGWGAGDWDNAKIHFEASRVVPTGVENRPKAIALLGCKKNQ